MLPYNNSLVGYLDILRVYCTITIYEGELNPNIMLVIGRLLVILLITIIFYEHQNRYLMNNDSLYIYNII